MYVIFFPGQAQSRACQCWCYVRPSRQFRWAQIHPQGYQPANKRLVRSSSTLQAFDIYNSVCLWFFLLRSVAKYLNCLLRLILTPSQSSNRCYRHQRYCRRVPSKPRPDTIIILIAGSPCTDWSAYGSQGGLNGKTMLAFLVMFGPLLFLKKKADRSLNTSSLATLLTSWNYYY